MIFTSTKYFKIQENQKRKCKKTCDVLHEEDSKGMMFAFQWSSQ